MSDPANKKHHCGDLTHTHPADQHGTDQTIDDDSSPRVFFFFSRALAPPPPPLPEMRQSSGGTKKTVVLVPSHERQGQRQRERRLEARLAESEDARIEVEAEAGRLQAFLDEMKGLGPPVVRGWRGEGAAAE